MRPVERFETQFGHMFHFADDAVIGRSFRVYGQWAIDEIALCAYIIGQNVNPGDFIDLGANVGAHTVAIASLFPTSQTFSFEANAPTFGILSSNVLVNGLENVNTFNYLIGETTGLCRVEVNEPAGPKNLGATSFRVVSFEGGTGRLMLQTRVDDVYPGDRSAVMVKVDVEGMDVEALLGTRSILERCRPTIYFENAVQENSGRLFDYLGALGYQTFWHINYPFDEQNFRGEISNIFGGAVEVATLCVHSENPQIEYFRQNLTATQNLLDNRAWQQCVSLNARLRDELRARWAKHSGLAVFRDHLLKQFKIGGDGQGWHEIGVLPSFVAVRQAMLLDVSTETLRRLLVPYIEATPLDEPAYLVRHPDVAAAVGAGQFASARHHYVQTGYFEGRSA